jgi:hypothetical protein
LGGGDLAEDGMVAVEPVGLNVRGEELAGVGVGAGVGHAEAAAFVLVAGGGLFGGPLVAGATRAPLKVTVYFIAELNVMANSAQDSPANGTFASMFAGIFERLRSW